jgi:hypothetical protein
MTYLSFIQSLLDEIACVNCLRCRCPSRSKVKILHCIHIADLIYYLLDNIMHRVFFFVYTKEPTETCECKPLPCGSVRSSLEFRDSACCARCKNLRVCVRVHLWCLFEQEQSERLKKRTCSFRK